MKKNKQFERDVHGLFLILGLVTVASVLVITVYLVISGIPAILEIGLWDFLNDLDLDNPLSCNTYDEISPLLHRIEKQNKQISSQVALLKEKTDQFEQTTSSMSEGLVLLDSEGKILSINPAAARLFETSKACVGLDFLVVDRSQAMSGGVKQALAKQHSDFRITKHGSEYQIGISPIVSGNRLLGAVVLAFDVTEQVNAQRNRQEFTANVSHELKTPLQSILNSAQLLQSGLVKPEDIVKHAAQQLGTKIHLDSTPNVGTTVIVTF